MEIDTVKLIFGDFYPDSEFVKAKNKLFPNSHYIRWGGGFGASEQTHSIILYCKACRKAEKQWYEEQGEDFEEVLKEYMQED